MDVLLDVELSEEEAAFDDLRRLEGGGVVFATLGDSREEHQPGQTSQDVVNWIKPVDLNEVEETYALKEEGEVEVQKGERGPREEQEEEKRVWLGFLNFKYEKSISQQQVQEQFVQILPMVSQDLLLAEAFDGNSALESSSDVEPAGFEEGNRPLESVSLPEPVSDVSTTAAAVSDLPGVTDSDEFNEAAFISQDVTSDSSEAELVLVPQLPTIPGLDEPVAIEPAESEFSSADEVSYELPSIAPEHVQKLLTRARLELAAGDVDVASVLTETAALGGLLFGQMMSPDQREQHLSAAREDLPERPHIERPAPDGAARGEARTAQRTPHMQVHREKERN